MSSRQSSPYESRVSSSLLTIVVLGLLVVPASAQTFQSLFEFVDYHKDGAVPAEVAPAQSRDGMLYGSTDQGGAYSQGTIFRFDPSTNTHTVLHDLAGSDGLGPYGSLTLGTDGNFYGVTQSGGSGLVGVLFRVTPAGAYRVLHSFMGGSDGSYPYAPPIEATDGNLYGTTSGVLGRIATVYKYSRAGQFSTIYQFDGSAGLIPLSPLLQAQDGNLYGTANSGGAYGCGTVYKLSRTGTLLHSHSFDCGANGAYPVGALIQASDGNFYGATQHGGLPGDPYGDGVLFKLTQEGGVSAAYKFGSSSSVDGSQSNIALLQATDGNLYASTLSRGLFGQGTLFRYGLDGTYSSYDDFSQGTTQVYASSLAQHTSGVLYGTTAYWVGGNGTVFSVDIAATPFIALVRYSGRVGDTVQVLGQGLLGTTSVTINGSPAAFTAASDTFLTATVPAGATSGSVVVTTASGALTSNRDYRIVK